MEFFDYKNATPEELDKQYSLIAKTMGDDRFFTRRELKALPEVLQEKEQVIAFTSGLMNKNSWLIVLTDKRIILLDKGLIWGLEQIAIELDKINAVSGKTGLIFGEIRIEDSSSERKITNVLKGTVKQFVNLAQQAIEERKQPKMQEQRDTSIDDNTPYDKLEKLAMLAEKGILTKEEFMIEKKKILDA